MKRITTILTFLMFLCMGTWADELPASTWNISTALPTDNWVAMGENTPAGVTSLGSYTAYYRTQEVTLSTAGMINVNFLYSSGDHRLEILGVDALNASSEVVASDYHFGYTGTNKSLNDYFLNGLSAGTYTLRYIINGNLSSSVGNITFRKFEADVVSSLPELTTDVNNPKYYSIGSYDRGGYFTSNGAGQSVTHVAFGAGSSWYFTAINGNNSGSVIGGVIAHCSDGTQLKQNWQTAASGQTVYILPNGYNTYGFCISKTFPISSNSCCDANNSNTGVGNYNPRGETDWKGTTWVIEPTVPIGPTGYYYFKGMATDRHPYLFSDFVGKSTNATYHHDLPGTPSNGHVWKVTYQGTTLTATNGEGLPVTIGSSTYETLNLSAASAGPDYYFTEAINLTNWGNYNGNEQQLTTWTDGGSGASDNRWTFELVDVSAGVYDVVVLGNNDGYVTYSDQNAKNGGFFVASSIAVGDLTAKAIDGYATSISISNRTITVSYNKLISYTLTDVNGATYEGTYNGPVGVTPTFTGCSGYTLTNESWSGTDYSATINFPFAVSSNDIDNYTFIGQFNNNVDRSAKEFLWHVRGTSIIIHAWDLPTADADDLDKYLWSIIPEFSDRSFTFTIKNKSTGTYVNSTCTENRHNVGDVTLSETATPMTYNATNPTKTCSPINAWYLPSTEKYLSANSVNNGVDAVLGVYGTVHDGISSGFPTYGDLISIYWQSKGVASEIAKAGRYGYPALTNEYTLALNGVKTALDGGSYTGNKTNYNTLCTFFEGFLAADVVVPTAGKFYRIKSSALHNASQPFLIGENHATQTTRAAFSTSEGSSAKSVWYFDGSHLLNFSNGYYAVNNNSFLGVATSPDATATSISFEQSGKKELGALSIKFNGNRYLYTNAGLYTDAGSGKDHNGYSFNVEEVTELPITVNHVGDKYYATLYMPVPVSISSGTTAYTLQLTGDKQWLTPTEVDGNVPAEQPVLLVGTSNEVTATVKSTAGSKVETPLEGTLAAIAVDPETDYFLGRYSESGEEEDYEVGFFKWTGTTLKGFRAYLPATKVTASRGFAIKWSDDDVTGIRAINNGKQAQNNGVYYDLSGRRVQNPQHGLYIVNGKKVVIK